MNKKTKILLKKTSGKTIGLFIDNANWFYPQKELRWRISFTKLKQFLLRNYRLSLLKIYAGTPLDYKNQRSFAKFVKVVQKEGYIIETKPLKKIWINKNKKIFEYKCNFDVEIALDVARNIKDLDLVIIGSGDSDFVPVRQFTKEYKKNFIVLCFEKGVAWEIRKGYHIFLEQIRNFIEMPTKKP
ncbi:hypothetical protein A2774_03455 [Candidatus Roizmanbacteria bacterium RIFCSPHIGHO2_01_FULL_39_12c]|uniref:NYN domain-containing protein n=1 Tax=Candidatus Roizmanbacteria bacterium RIFCSPHIGHO2_01_FULL_39_12c TaxID=1802031 RepID=A0A1F7G908_9BACT|nr:MAG: hypothetical protein A2774_03455 [Candidatus Roizmanbacteria bacterium RIFCSPHIGHO2_01_FULL_39_12c]OGK47842.1 MAG: hypothetical protein A2963_03240 [Candidatus Roizmanbacteria bacterium RIFCSPLOWO2_01_FULL_40_13]